MKNVVAPFPANRRVATRATLPETSEFDVEALRRRGGGYEDKASLTKCGSPTTSDLFHHLFKTEQTPTLQRH
jgi:hypothetical protein